MTITLSQFAYRVGQTGSYFFSPKTMKFFGDTRKNYRLSTVNIDGKEYYKLSRKKPVKHGLQSPAYFDMTFERVFVEEK